MEQENNYKRYRVTYTYLNCYGNKITTGVYVSGEDELKRTLERLAEPERSVVNYIVTEVDG